MIYLTAIHTDEENILNIRREQKRKRFIVSSVGENEERIEIVLDGTVWQKIKEGSNSERTAIYNISWKYYGRQDTLNEIS